MGHEPVKQPRSCRCAVPGCRAWAKHGQPFCRAHEHTPVLRRSVTALLSRLNSLPAEGDAADASERAALIEQELRRLLAAREVFLAWVEELHAKPDASASGLSPAQFLRAWNDSVARLLQLVRARQDLSDDQAAWFGTLMQNARARLEAHLAGEEIHRGDAEFAEKREEEGDTTGIERM